MTRWRTLSSFCVAVLVAITASIVWLDPGGGLRAGGATPTGTDPTQPWVMFGHDGLHSGASTDANLTSLTAPRLHVAWSHEVGPLPKPVSASPVVAFDATLGKMLVYDVNATGSIAAFDANTGKAIWQATLPYGQVGSERALQDVSTPAIDGNTLYVGTTAALVALDATTGAVNCSFPIPVQPPSTEAGVIDSSPVVGHFDPSGPIVFFGDKGESEPNNGGHEWAVTGVGNTAGGCQQAWVFNSWQIQTPPAKLVGSWSSPALVQSANGTWLLVFGSSDPDDAVYALDASTGALVWRFQTPPNGPDHDVGAGPTISPPGANGFPDGVVYVDGKDTIEFAIDLSTGTQLWSFNMGTDTGVSVDAVSSGALVGNTLYVPYAHWVYAFDATTGAVLWKTDVGTGQFFSSSSVVSPASGVAGDPVLVLGNVTGTVYVFDAVTGTVLTTVSLGSPIFSSAAISGSDVFEANGAGRIVALTVDPVVPTLTLSGAPFTGANTYGVALTVPAGGPAPTAGVTVSDSGGQSCTSALTGGGTSYTGTCTIASETAGQKVTASYAGDAYYAPTTSGHLTVRAPVPAVSAVSPAAGPLKGGTAITVTGTGFSAGAKVTIGGVQATKVQVLSATVLTAITPRGTAGTYDVLVSAAGGTSPAAAPADSFTYDPVPVVTGLSSTTGVGTAGGYPVDISGTGFTPGATVTLGQGKGSVVNAVTWTVTTVTATDITATVGASIPGTFSVFVTTPGGTSAVSSASMFTVTR